MKVGAMSRMTTGCKERQNLEVKRKGGRVLGYLCITLANSSWVRDVTPPNWVKF